MASQLCHGGLAASPAEMASDCHDAVDPDRDADPSCPASEVVPDFGKMPAFAPLPAATGLTVHDVRRPLAGVTQRLECPGDGPELSRLCRLLI